MTHSKRIYRDLSSNYPGIFVTITLIDSTSVLINFTHDLNEKGYAFRKKYINYELAINSTSAYILNENSGVKFPIDGITDDILSISYEKLENDIKNGLIPLPDNGNGYVDLNTPIDFT